VVFSILMYVYILHYELIEMERTRKMEMIFATVFSFSPLKILEVI